MIKLLKVSLALLAALALEGLLAGSAAAIPLGFSCITGNLAGSARRSSPWT